MIIHEMSIILNIMTIIQKIYILYLITLTIFLKILMFCLKNVRFQCFRLFCDLLEKKSDQCSENK